MKAFMVILFITIIGFSNAFMVLSLSNKQEDERFIEDMTGSFVFVYLIGLGQFDTGFGSGNIALCWFFFIVSTLFHQVVMMNLLIAIISETFARVQEEAIACQYQEMASIVAENDYLVPHYRRVQQCMPNKMLLFAREEEEEAANED